MTNTTTTPAVTNALSGYKTYIVAGLGLLYFIVAFFTGHIDSNTAASGILNSAALATLRSALTTYLGPLTGFALDRLIGDLGAFLDQEKASSKLTVTRKSSYEK
jgi:hypothetical protein